MSEDKAVEYVMVINFILDGVQVKFTGETVQFTNDGDKPVRHRHLKTVEAVQEVMREFIYRNRILRKEQNG